MPVFKKLSFEVSAGDAQACAGAIEDWEAPWPLAVTSFEIANSSNWLVEAYFDESTPETSLRAAFDDTFAQRRLRCVLSTVPDEDWTAKVQRDLAPVRAGRFVVHGSHDRARVQPAQWAIEIDAGEAFGTAHHATTAGCLRAIDRLARANAFERIADVGCGTGVLAIAAAKAWPAAEVIAGDNDPIATRITRENARQNGVAARIGVVTAQGLEHPRLRGKPYDLIIANILASPLVALAPAFAHASTSNGVIILSGLLTCQAATVLGAYRPRGFRLVAHGTQGDWSTLLLRRGDRHLR